MTALTVSFVNWLYEAAYEKFKGYERVIASSSFEVVLNADVELWSCRFRIESLAWSESEKILWLEFATKLGTVLNNRFGDASFLP